MLAHLVDVSIRSLALALAAGGALWLSGRRRTGAIEQAVWTLVTVGMLALFGFGWALPRMPVRVLKAPSGSSVAAPPTVSVRLTHFDLPTPADTPAPTQTTSAPRREIDWLMTAYAAISFAFSARFGVGMLLVRRLIRGSTDAGGFRESEAIAVPMTLGWLRPVIMLPTEWRDWEPSKLAAVLAHEGTHARRRDGLTAAIAGINRCLFWFHPLAWWLERRLALTAELACDEACVAEQGDCRAYASLLVEMARVVDPAQGRLRRHALAMAAGSQVKLRVESLLADGRKFSRGLNATAWTAIALGAAPILCVAGTITVEHRTPLVPLSFPPLSTPEPPVLIAQGRPTGPNPESPAVAKAPVQFEVASIRPTLTPSFMDRLAVSPGRLDLASVTVQRLMEYAFQLPQKQVDGPAWIHHWGGPRFDIVAKLPQGVTRDQLPEMIRALLVDRFKLTYHMEQREQDVEVLALSKGALKLEESAASTAPPPAGTDAAEGMQTVNGLLTRLGDSANGRLESEGNSRIDGYKKTRPSEDTTHYDYTGTLQGFADYMVEELQRPVADMTGIKGRYHIVLDVKFDSSAYPPPKTIADLEDQTTEYRNHLNSELQKLGLQFEIRKAPVEYVVADSVEQKPTDN